MITQKIVEELKKVGYDVKKIDLEKREAIKCTKEIKCIWFHDKMIRDFTTFDWTKKSHKAYLTDVVRKCIKNAGFKAFKDIPKEKREEIKQHIISEGKKIIMKEFDPIKKPFGEALYE